MNQCNLLIGSGTNKTVWNPAMDLHGVKKSLQPLVHFAWYWLFYQAGLSQYADSQTHSKMLVCF